MTSAQARAELRLEERAIEKELVECAQQNDYGAYEALYEMHVGRVYALCVRLCRDRDMAEDLAQESFVLAWRKLSHFRDHDKV